MSNTYYSNARISAVPLLIGYFKDLGAISPEKAIDFGVKQQVEIFGGVYPSIFLTAKLFGYGLFIKKTPDNKYYLYEPGIEQYGKQNQKIIVIILVGTLMTLITAGTIGLLVSFLNI